jgi:hypothetical protein
MISPADNGHTVTVNFGGCAGLITKVANGNGAPSRARLPAGPAIAAAGHLRAALKLHCAATAAQSPETTATCLFRSVAAIPTVRGLKEGIA